jgi:hypothetical protein
MSIVRDYFLSFEESKLKKTIQTNPKYKYFKQTHFTAGDEEQFHKKLGQLELGQTIYKSRIHLKKNIFKDFEFKSLFWEKYKKSNTELIRMNTFNHFFNKFKKGTFVKIQNNELKVFLPFSKQKFVNEWSDKIKIDPKYGNMYNFIEYINKMTGKSYKININKFCNNWYANNCLIRYEFPIHEGDSNVPQMSDMLKTLCKERKIPDIEFFMNRRDFPQLKRNNTEAYEHLFGENQPLLSHNYTKYTPFLSMVTTKEHADIPIPTGDDWSRISSIENKFFTGSKEYPDVKQFNIPWIHRKPTAIFRGSSTGAGVTIDTNMRLKLAYLSVNLEMNSEPPLLDAGITKWQLRPRKLKDCEYLQTIDIYNLEKMGIKLVSFLTPIQQSEYKYIINVDGHVSAFRLSLEMSMGCCILLVESKYELWFKSLIKPMIHYVPVKEDLSDLIEKIKWCRDNDTEAEKIAENSKEFYKKYLDKNAILDYLQKIFVDLKKYIK